MPNNSSSSSLSRLWAIILHVLLGPGTFCALISAPELRALLPARPPPAALRQCGRRAEGAARVVRGRLPASDSAYGVAMGLEIKRSKAAVPL